MGADEAEAVGDAALPRLMREPGEGTDRIARGVEVATNEEHRCVWIDVGIGAETLGRIEERVDALDGVDAADEEDERLVGRKGEGDPGGEAILWAEEIEVDAGRNGANLFGWGTLPPDEVGAFVGVGGDQAVGEVEQPALGLEAEVGLPVDGVGDGILHMGGRVEHLDEWGVPVAFSEVTDPA